jgi:hypothetical protein
MTLLPQVRDQLDEAAKRRARSRRTRLTTRISPIGIERRASLTGPSRAAPSSRSPAPRLVARAVGVAVVVLVPLAVFVGALVLLRGGANPPSTTKLTGGTVIEQLVDILAVLRRPQTDADRLPDSLVAGPGMAVNVGAPDRRLARLATVTPWGQKVFIAPMHPLSAADIAALKRKYPGLARALASRPAQKVTLGLFGNRERAFGSVSDVEAGRESTFDGANSILGLGGPGPPLRVLMVIPDGVAKVAFALPRQAYPGAIAYPKPETITVPVHDNIAAFQTDRYIDEDHWSRIGMTWYAPSGAILKRTGDFSQLNSIGPDPMLSAAVRINNPSTWDAVTVVPRNGNPSTTFTIAFRRPVSGAHRYAFLFSGPTANGGCASPVSHTPIIRGPDLGIPSNGSGQIASTQFSNRTWCPGNYRVSVALAGSKPFSTTRFTVQP